jgi:hypothetical protein
LIKIFTKISLKLIKMKKQCCACGAEIDEDSEEAIVDMPFAGELVCFCSEKCKEEDTKGL